MTCGMSIYQLRYLFQKDFGTEFYFIHFGFERDRMCNTWEIQFFWMGIRFWMCISAGAPHPELMAALEAVVSDLKGGEVQEGLSKEKAK